jgi:hypothetical protein
MMPQPMLIEEEIAEEARAQEQYVRQVEDHSRPAGEVLNDQQADGAATAAPASFVP